MIRVFIDKLGNGHTDIFIKIEGLVDRLEIADSYFLADFLELKEVDFKKVDQDKLINLKVSELLKLWKSKVEQIERNEIEFLLFDLSDQGISGLLMEGKKHGINLKVVYSTELQGYNINKSLLNDKVKNNTVIFKDKDDNQWIKSKESILKGIEWSLNELN